MKLRTRLMYLNLGVIILITVSMVGYLLFENYSTNKVSAMEQIELVTQKIAKEMEAMLDDAQHDAIGIGNSIELMIESGGDDRQIVIAYLEEVLKENANYLYTWAVFEPNAFDYKDGQYINQKGSDDTGRFSPSWGKSGDALLLEHCKNVEEKDYYTVPKKTGKFYITDPATYELGGKDVTTVTFCEPLYRDGKFIGVAGLDISLTTLRDINVDVKFFENGYGRLISEKGIVLAHPDED